MSSDLIEVFTGANMLAAETNATEQCDKRIVKDRQIGDGFSNLIGDCAELRALKLRIDRIKNIVSPILILGETGTGKEVIAKCLHELSSRKCEPFCAVNCSAIPENLLESELFGHKKGAFTDAKTDKKGLFETLGAGTLLLDEIGDMPISLQAKLLRVLQDRVYTPLGSNVPLLLRAGILCATHRNLILEVHENRFREDLLFRINVIVLNAPPLRSRGEDLPILVKHFLQIFNKLYNRNITYPDALLIKEMQDYQWPGNIRELKNAIERAVLLAPDDKLERNDLFFYMQNQRSPIVTLAESSAPKPRESTVDLTKPMNEAKLLFERAYLLHHLESGHGNISDASRTMGRYRADVYRMLEKHGLNAQYFRGPAGA